MGQDWRPNRALSNPLVLKLLKLAERRIKISTRPKDSLKYAMAGAYFCFCYVVSLRSPEGLMVDIPGLLQYGEASEEHVVIPLLGQVKGEDHTTRQHLLHCVNETGSGICVRRWESRLKKVHEALGRTVGPAFVNPGTKKQSSTAEMNDIFLDLLTEIHEDNRNLFSVDIRTPVDLHEKFNVFRSFRRGSESQATDRT